MKKFYLIIMTLLLFVSCSTTNYLSRRNVYEMDEISYVLANYYPQLHYYYMEGVLDIDSMKEVTLEDGTLDYKIKYHFIRYYYRNYSERMEIMKVHFPELYQMYTNGVIEVNSLYKYVEKSTGKIRHHISYRNIYDYYYRYYPGLHGTHIYHYGPRYRPAPPRPVPVPKVNPNPPRRQESNINRGNRSNSGSSRSGSGRRR